MVKYIYLVQTLLYARLIYPTVWSVSSRGCLSEITSKIAKTKLLISLHTTRLLLPQPSPPKRWHPCPSGYADLGIILDPSLSPLSFPVFNLSTSPAASTFKIARLWPWPTTSSAAALTWTAIINSTTVSDCDWELPDFTHQDSSLNTEARMPLLHASLTWLPISLRVKVEVYNCLSNSELSAVMATFFICNVRYHSHSLHVATKALKKFPVRLRNSTLHRIPFKQSHVPSDYHVGHCKPMRPKWVGPFQLFDLFSCLLLPTPIHPSYSDLLPFVPPKYLAQSCSRFCSFCLEGPSLDVCMVSALPPAVLAFAVQLPSPSFISILLALLYYFLFTMHLTS